MGMVFESCLECQNRQHQILTMEINKQSITEILIYQNVKPTSLQIVAYSFRKMFDLELEDFDLKSITNQEYIESNNSSQLSMFSTKSKTHSEGIKSNITGCYRLRLSLENNYYSKRSWKKSITSSGNTSYFLPIISERKIHYKRLIKNIVKQRSLKDVIKNVGFGFNCHYHQQCCLPKEGIYLFSNAQLAFKEAQKIPLQDQKFYKCIIECNVCQQAMHFNIEQSRQGNCIIEQDDNIQVTAILLREIKIFVA